MIARSILTLSLILLLPACFNKKPQAVGFSFKKPTLEELRSKNHELDRFSSDGNGNTPQSIAKSDIHDIHTEIKHYEAKYGDIAIPIGAKAMERYFTVSDLGLTLGYSSQQSRSEVTKFYERSMEQAGWIKKTLFKGNIETLLIVEKKHRICAISLRDTARGTQIILTISQKEEDFS